jgi:hypothetical protein
MDLTGAILLVGIGLVIGFLVGVLVFTLLKDSNSERASREQVLSDSEQSVRIWREGKEQRLVVEIGGVSHYRSSDLDENQNHIISGLLRELQAWMGLTAPPPAETVKPAAPEIDEETQKTSLNPLKIFSRSIEPLEKTGSGDTDLSIVGQIDEILQAKLAGTHLDERGIRLVEGPDQSMVIQVGLQSYDEIDAVPDDQVRQLIRLSVAEWENSLGD